VAHAKAVGHPFSLALALSWGAFTLAEAGDFEEALDFCRQCTALCEAQSLPFWAGLSMVSAGIAAAREEKYSDADVQLERGQQYLITTGSRVAQGRTRGWRALVLAHLGRYDEARLEAETAREHSRSTGEIVYVPLGAHARGIAELLDPNGAHVAAEHWFQTALSERSAIICGSLAAPRPRVRRTMMPIRRVSLHDPEESLGNLYCGYSTNRVDSGEHVM